MQRLFPRPLFALAVAALLAPGAAATWYSYGTFEPDNALDSADLMRVDPPGTATNLLYFNVYNGINIATVRASPVNPNLGVIESANEPHGFESFNAVFGVWVDCNGDGYVGMAESALREYPANLLLAGSICAPITGPTNRWSPGAHNYNGWVSELVPIGGALAVGGGNDTTDLRVYKDNSSMVWGDAGTPDGGAAGASCPIAPQPRGTYQTTGGALNYLDCHLDRDSTGGLGLMETMDRPWTGGRLGGGFVPGLGADPFGLTFANDDDARGHAFWDRPTLGSEAEERSPVFVYDCSADRVTVGGTLDGAGVGPSLDSAVGALADVPEAGEFVASNYEDFRDVDMTAVDPRVSDGDPSTWTAPALVNHTIEGTNSTLTGGIRGSADCDTSNDAGHDFYGASWATFYVGESEFNAVSAVNKSESDLNFQFQYWDRGVGLVGFGPQVPIIGGAAGFIVPGKFYSNWNPGRTYLKVDNNRFLRADIEEGTTTLPGPELWTFYAHAGQATIDRGFALPSATTGAYGEAQCDGYEGTINPNSGWNCDPIRWYRNPDGTATTETLPRARPGQPYEFRDVDCLDGRIGALGVGTQPAYYGEAPCQPYVG